jgi:hypothetical protein
LDTRADRRFVVRPWHLFTVGWTLGAAALFERFQAFRSGREYVLCHAAPVLNDFTYAALALVGAAFLVASIGTATAADGTPRTAYLVVCLLAVLAFLVAADRVDAHGAQRAAKLAAMKSDERTCDYTPQIYTVTPGWFSW